MSPIRIGFVGLSKEGWASLSLAPPLLAAPLSAQYTLTAVSTTSPASAAASAQKYSDLAGHAVKPFHGDTAAIAGDPEVDLVAVAVNAPSHKKAVLPAIAAGKDVFVEWPAGKALAETEEMARAAREKGVRTLVGLQGRLSPAVQKIKALVDGDKIGKVVSSSVVALAPREIFYWGPWVYERSSYTTDVNAGATMLDVAMGHMLDSFTYVLGGFSSVSASSSTQYPTATLFTSDHQPTGKTVPVSAADHVAFSGTLTSGAFSSVAWRGGLSSSPGRAQFRWEIDGEAGSIRVENDALAGSFVQVFEPKVYLNGELVEVVGDELPSNPARAWNEFAKGKEGKGATLEDAVRCRRLIDAVGRSAKEGRRVEL